MVNSRASKPLKPMHILVTGASGFLGSYAIAELLKSGHQVLALSRRSIAPAPSSPSLTWAQADLSQTGDSLVPLLEGIDAVVHLAAAMSGDYATQYACSVTATENLLAAMTRAEVTRLVAISSFSAYDYQALVAGSTLDERSPVEALPINRDVYTQMKLSQERLVKNFEAGGGQVTVIRPGIIYDADHLVNAFLGNCLLGKLWVRVGRSAKLPLAYAGHCAEVIAKSLSTAGAIGETLNVVDDNLPNQATFSKLVAQAHQRAMPTVVIPWSLMSFLSGALWQMNQALGGALKVPGLLVPARLHARCKPLEYSNRRVKEILGWQPTHQFEAVVTAGVTDLV